MMLLQHYSKTPLVTTGITNMSARCTLRIEMDFYPPKKIHSFVSTFLPNIFFSQRDKTMKAKNYKQVGMYI